MRFLFTTQISDDLGLLTRTLPVAEELTRRGHQAFFCNPARAPARLIAQAGFTNLLPRNPLYFVLDLLSRDELNLRGLRQAARNGRFKTQFGGFLGFAHQAIRMIPTRLAMIDENVWSLDHLAAATGMMNDNYLRAEVEALVGLIQEHHIDMVIDSFSPMACIAARRAGVPLATILQADMHPANRGFIWWKEPPAGLPSPTPAINRLLLSYGLPLIRKTEDLFLGEATLVLGMPETDPLPPEAHADYVGAILWQKAGEGAPDWFDELDPARPVVWVYSGNPRYLPFASPVDSALVITACVQALGGEDIQVVLTTGHHVLPKEMLPLPLNFRTFPFVPGLQMARRSDLLIHHGGYGSCQTGLYCGTPAVIIPTYSERESNARRVAATGAGEYILPAAERWGRKSLESDRLRTLINKVLADPSYRQNALRVSKKLMEYGGAVQAAERILHSFVNG